MSPLARQGQFLAVFSPSFMHKSKSMRVPVQWLLSFGGATLYPMCIAIRGSRTSCIAEKLTPGGAVVHV